MFAVSANSVFGQKLKADPAKSQVKWTGNKVGGSHNGEVKLKSGELEIKGDQIVKGNFVIDMTSIVNNDLEDKEYNQKLVGHLKSDDFFGVEKYPTSTLVIKKSTKFVNNKATVTADLSIKGKTDEIVFDVTRNDKVFTSKIEIDRSKYDVRYGSKSFFDNLGDKVIDDIFILDVKLVCL
jgi:polyisoprenoid-binding protein YceI